MNLQQRIDLLVELKDYLLTDGPEFREVKARAQQHNGWFTPEFIDLAVKNICDAYLDRQKLQDWAKHYRLDDNIEKKHVGIVMAGNIPLVGFHDLLSVFVCGHRQSIKLSSKDEILLPHIVEKMAGHDLTIQHDIVFSPMLKGCDAYIATGSNNSARYFEQYFSKYANIIRRNRTSVAILNGKESTTELEALADDVHQFFGLGCRNVTKLYVPRDYDFVRLLEAFRKYSYFADHNKYKNNYDYQLSVVLMNNVYYMTNGSVLLIEDNAYFSPISRVNYSFYDKVDELEFLKKDEDIQCIVGQGFIPFGNAQQPGLFDYADGVDTMQFLLTL